MPFHEGESFEKLATKENRSLSVHEEGLNCTDLTLIDNIQEAIIKGNRLVKLISWAILRFKYINDEAFS